MKIAKEGNEVAACVVIVLNLIIVLGTTIWGAVETNKYIELARASSYYESFENSKKEINEMNFYFDDIQTENEVKEELTNFMIMGQNSQIAIVVLGIGIFASMWSYIFTFIPDLIEKFVRIDLKFKWNEKVFCLLFVADCIGLLSTVSSVVSYANAIQNISPK